MDALRSDAGGRGQAGSPHISTQELLPVVLSLVCQSIRVAFPGMAGAADLRLGKDGFAADSIDVVEAATAVSEMFLLGELGIDDYLLRDTRMGAWSELAEHALSLSGGKICFRSSGSTGRPSSNVHDLALLHQEAAFFSRRVEGCRVVLVSPPHHIYGFIWGPLLARAMGLRCHPMLHSGVSAWTHEALAEGDIVVGFPLFWSWFERTRGTRSSRLSAISSTAPLPGELALALGGMGIRPVMEIFGSSETAGLGWRDHPGRAFELLPHWRCCGDADFVERLMPDGQWRSSVSLPDHVQWSADRRSFTPRGRADGAIQVGGTNVFPEAIAGRMCAEVPGVAESVLRPSDEEGPHVRLKAFVVPHTGEIDLRDLEQRLHAWSRQCLRPAERPVSVTFGSQLPRNPMGKLADW